MDVQQGPVPVGDLHIPAGTLGCGGEMTKARKVGDWKAVANGRANKVRDMPRGRGLSNIPSPSDVGSAAYRRLIAKIGKTGR